MLKVRTAFITEINVIIFLLVNLCIQQTFIKYRCYDVSVVL